MCAEILDALRTVRLDDAARVMVLTGTGRGFCTGGDVSPDAGFDDHTSHQIGRARELREDSHTRWSPPCTSSTSPSCAR